MEFSLKASSALKWFLLSLMHFIHNKQPSNQLMQQNIKSATSYVPTSYARPGRCIKLWISQMWSLSACRWRVNKRTVDVRAKRKHRAGWGCRAGGGPPAHRPFPSGAGAPLGKHIHLVRGHRVSMAWEKGDTLLPLPGSLIHSLSIHFWAPALILCTVPTLGIPYQHSETEAGRRLETPTPGFEFSVACFPYPWRG